MSLRGEVPGGAVDDDDTGLGTPAQLEPVEKRVLLGLRQLVRARSPTAWPPNSLRRAAFTFAANDSSCRDANRAKSAAVITGTGTSSAIASAIVQRPSPESST